MCRPTDTRERGQCNTHVLWQKCVTAPGSRGGQYRDAQMSCSLCVQETSPAATGKGGGQLGGGGGGGVYSALHLVCRMAPFTHCFQVLLAALLPEAAWPLVPYLTPLTHAGVPPEYVFYRNPPIPPPYTLPKGDLRVGQVPGSGP